MLELREGSNLLGVSLNWSSSDCPFNSPLIIIRLVHLVGIPLSLFRNYSESEDQMIVWLGGGWGPKYWTSLLSIRRELNGSLPGRSCLKHFLICTLLMARYQIYVLYANLEIALLDLNFEFFKINSYNELSLFNLHFRADFVCLNWYFY